jgi:hypothetical protein
LQFIFQPFKHSPQEDTHKYQNLTNNSQKLSEKRKRKPEKISGDSYGLAEGKRRTPPYSREPLR